MRKQIYCLLSFLWISCLSVSAADRWAINSAGGITWQVDERVPHEDHIEMSGLRVSTVLRYGVDANGAFMLNRSMVWPMLRTIPNNTHASLMRRFAWDVTDMVEVNGQSLLNEKVKEVTLNGTMVVQSEYTLPRKEKLGLTRILFPSVSNPAFCEKYILRNTGESTISIEIPSSRSVVETDAAKGVDGSYKLVSTINGQATRQLQPGEELTFSAIFAGYKKNESELSFDIDRELQARQDLIAGFWDNLVLDTPDPVINTMFAFAKIRGAESIYDTKGGLMHGPGGESYYAAIWANDQAEYINPFFPFLGYDRGNRSALCSFGYFARYMNPDYRPIPSSIIAEGTDIWNGAGDRGDAAMIAYGAARYALARGDAAVPPLTPREADVILRKATEAPWSGEYEKNTAAGTYLCRQCGVALYRSSDKFDSGCGWPAFTKPIEGPAVVEKEDLSHGMRRTEVRSRAGDSHLGHVFTGDPESPNGVRYCINSAALRFVPYEKMETEGYGYLLYLFEK